MNLINKWMLGLAVLLMPLAAIAQSITVGSDAGGPGDPVVIPVTYTAGATDIAGFDLDVAFDSSQFSAASASCTVNTACAGAFTNCSVSPAGTANFILAAGAACTSGTLGELTLIIDAAATAGAKALALTVVGLSDPAGSDLPLDTAATTDGTVTVTAPAYSSSPAPGQINMAGQQGVAINDVMISISNSGDPGTTLSGTCSLTGDSQISTTGSAFDILQGSSPAVQTVSCSSAAQGTYNASLSCTHNAAGSPAVYPVECIVGPPPPQPPAIFSSNPATGSTVDMTAAGDVIVGGTVPPSMLTLSNTAAAGAQDLTGLSCTKSGDAAITVAPAVSGASLAPGASTSVTFSCATTAAGSFSATYACDYTTDALSETPVTGTASYTYTCEVMPPKSVVAPQVPSGTTLTKTALFGRSAQFQVGFDETADQGVDGGLTCSLATGTDFVLDSTMPATIPSGGSFSVMVTGTASSDPLNPIVTDTLNCTYTDTDNTAGVDVSYPLVLRAVNITRPVNVPTLSQWGLAIMALVLLGAGMVGFRRYH